jgi:hypothetical protein
MNVPVVTITAEQGNVRPSASRTALTRRRPSPSTTSISSTNPSMISSPRASASTLCTASA